MPVALCKCKILELLLGIGKKKKAECFKSLQNVLKKCATPAKADNNKKSRLKNRRGKLSKHSACKVVNNIRRNLSLCTFKAQKRSYTCFYWKFSC